MKTHSGLTLIELLVTLAVLSILIAVAAPNFTNISSGNKLTAEVNGFVGALAYARSEAVTRNTTVTVAAVPGTPTKWENGWTIKVGTVPLRESGAMPPNVVVTNSNPTSLTPIDFRGDGSSALNNISIKLCDVNNPGANKEPNIDISSTGRTTSSPNATCP